MGERIKVVVPMDEAGVADRGAQLPDELFRPGFEEGLRTEAEGYYAVCIRSRGVGTRLSRRRRSRLHRESRA